MGEGIKKQGYHQKRANRWDKLNGGVKEVFSHVRIDEINAACDRFLEAREPNYAANKARAKNLLSGRLLGRSQEEVLGS